jgi:hypothetical protein
MKNRRNGWPARRRYRREADRIARNWFGYADQRSMCHARNVERLREILENRPDSAESELFVTREVADVLHSRPKVIRWLAYCRHIPSEKLPGERARKLWFQAGAIRKYLDSRRLDLNSLGRPENSRALRSATIAANPHFGGTAVTKDRAAEELRITKHGVEYYLARGILKRAPSSKCVTLITRKSLASLAWKRIAKAERGYKLAAEKRQKICGV